jgi:hypothetical protein
MSPGAAVGFPHPRHWPAYEPLSVGPNRAEQRLDGLKLRADAAQMTVVQRKPALMRPPRLPNATRRSLHCCWSADPIAPPRNVVSCNTSGPHPMTAFGLQSATKGS